jgi:hypothetical protein
MFTIQKRLEKEYKLSDKYISVRFFSVTKFGIMGDLEKVLFCSLFLSVAFAAAQDSGNIISVVYILHVSQHRIVYYGNV